MDKKTKIILAAVLVLVGAAFYFRGLVFAASVNGSFISRVSVIKELEKQGGKSVLDSLITQKLVENEISKQKITVSQDEISQEIKKIEQQVTSQGGTLKEVLSSRGMTESDLQKQIILQKQMEKLLADKATVTDEEVEKYIKDNKVTIPAGQEAQTKDQIKNSLRGQKLSQAADAFISELKSKASINYYVNY